MKSILAKLFVGAFICAVALPTAALNLNWLKHSPASYFTEEDWRLSQEAAQKALEDTADGTAINWENKDTGASGSSKPLKSGVKDGLRCRYLKMQNSARGTNADSVFLFCKQQDGTWKVNSKKK